MDVTPGLIASASYRDASKEVVEQVTNGCGPGGWKFDLIPDTIYGLSIKEPCNIHDWDYTVGQTERDKEVADHRLLVNIRTLITKQKGFLAYLLRPLRRVRADEYYEAVKLFGHSAFWANKKEALDGRES